MAEMNFLQQVADYIARELISGEFVRKDSGIVAVLPNKRSGIFLKTYLRDAVARYTARPVFMPRVITLERFAHIFSGAELMSSMERIFLLYDCYRNILQRKGLESSIRPFDKFIFWGELILKDFDSIDMAMANAADMYANLSRYKEISSNFLNEEQKDIIRNLWGDTSLTTSVADFWNHINHEHAAQPTSLSYKFLSLWSILGELYHDYTTRVTEAGMTTPGLMWRKTAEIFKASEDDMPENRKYYFIGLSELTISQYIILERLKKRGHAKFFWDTSSPLMAEESIRKNLFPTLDRLVSGFSEPDDFNLLLPSGEPEIEVIGVGSRAAQAKVTSTLLKELHDSELMKDGSLDSCVIVPDESILSSLLLSIPDEIKCLNVTLGLNFRNTPFASFIRSITAMQSGMRQIKERWSVRRDILKEICRHHLIYASSPEAADRLGAYIDKNRTFYFDAEKLAEEFPEFAFFFNPIKSKNSIEEAAQYLIELLTKLSESLKDDTAGSVSDHDLSLLEEIKDEIGKVKALALHYKVDVSTMTALGFFERMLNVRRLDANGTPLAGLQILGVPEGRALNFDNIIILSMNEKKFPPKTDIRSLIPENLRVGWGLTPASHLDEAYTYYFYRIISRAKRVTLLYDSRNGSFGAGEVSRFIVQLQRLFNKRITLRNTFMPAALDTTKTISISKDKRILERLEEFKAGGQRFLSASALKTYLSCPLKFFLQTVERMYGEDDDKDYVTAAKRGDIIHYALQLLYEAKTGEKIDCKTLKEMADDSYTIEKAVLKAIAKKHLLTDEIIESEDLGGDLMLTLKQACTVIKLIFEEEARVAGNDYFHFKAAEYKVAKPWKISDKHDVNIKMYIDRIDSLPDGSLRFIDYKTGKAETKVPDIESLFKRGAMSSDAVFQLLLYCMAYGDIEDYNDGISPVVYAFKYLGNEPIRRVTVNGNIITDHRTVREEYLSHFNKLIDEIFDPEVNFTQTDNPDNCKYCKFAEICSRH